MKVSDYLPTKTDEVVSIKSVGDQLVVDGKRHKGIFIFPDGEEAICHAINNYDKLDEEIAALREALRLKELECKALSGDKDSLINFVNDVADNGCWPAMADEAEYLLEHI